MGPAMEAYAWPGDPDFAGRCADALTTADALCRAQEVEAAPFAGKYAAADLLRDVLDEAKMRMAASIGEPGGQRAAEEEAAAALALRRGLALLETDLLAEGEGCVREAVAALEGDPARHVLLLLEAYNGLGALGCGRGAFDEAFTALRRAEALHADAVSASGGGGGGGDSAMMGRGGSVTPGFA